MNEDFLQRKLDERKDNGSFRKLPSQRGSMTDFCSNDYLGIVKNGLLPFSPPQPTGSTGSRLLTGNFGLAEEAEQVIAAFHQAEAGLLFNSGYDANLGLLSSIPQRGDTILFDHLAHASIRDGARLSFARSHSFGHNDPGDLEKKLRVATGNIFVVTESVFSMDGDLCPLKELIAVCEKFGARLIVDEAHATGVIGPKGEGLVQLEGVHNRIFARIHTFGKACGTHGAIVLGSSRLRDYLINFARSFIYSTALPPQTVSHILASYKLFPVMIREREVLAGLASRFQAMAETLPLLKSYTAIQGVIVSGNLLARQLANRLQESNLEVRPILYPTVPKGQERLRIVLHAFNTEEELDRLLNCLKNSF